MTRGCIPLGLRLEGAFHFGLSPGDAAAAEETDGGVAERQTGGPTRGDRDQEIIEFG